MYHSEIVAPPAPGFRFSEPTVAVDTKGYLKARKFLRGHWGATAHKPCFVSDPQKLLHLSKKIVPLPSSQVQRVLQKQSLSHKRATSLVREAFLNRDRQTLRELERLLSGGGMLWEDRWENLVVDEGLNDILDVYLSGGTQDTSWFVGLLGASPTPAADWTATGGTAGGVAGADFVDYDEAVLQAFTDGGVASESVDNSSSPAVFTCDTNSSTVGGAFLIGTNAKATPAGIVYAAGAFTGGNKALDDNDTITVTATFTSADDGA